MLLDCFDFELPGDLIARRPVSPRDSSRLLCIGPKLKDGFFSDLPDILNSGDVLVLNDTKVMQARIRCQRVAKRGVANVEITLLSEMARFNEACRWKALGRPSKRLGVGDILLVGDNLSAEIVKKSEGGEFEVNFLFSPEKLTFLLEKVGVMPIPPYLGRKADKRDTQDYQTVFAQHLGAIAAPTASLHMTPLLLKRLEAKGISLAFITLHVGSGTFRPITSQRVESHRIEPEWGQISKPSANLINKCKKEGGRIVALGTTSLRLLEFAADKNGTVAPFLGNTDLFVRPGYSFKAVDCLITNFHLPKSTLFMLVCAFLGQHKISAAYKHAVARKYRFYTYGDACFLNRCGLETIKNS